jgi:hypothetical protein
MATTQTKPVVLMHPITTVDGREIKEVALGRRLTGADLIEVDDISGGNRRTAHLIARVNGDITPEDAGKLDAADFLECSKRVEGFLEYQPPTSDALPATSPSSSTGSRQKSGD